MISDKLLKNHALRDMCIQSMFHIFTTSIDGLVTKGTVLNSFFLLRLVLIRGKGRTISERAHMAQCFLQHRSIYHSVLFQSM